MERPKINSQSLKERFPEIYKKFFSKCFLVVSAPGNFWWAGEHSVLYGVPGIKQNLPIRVYVGLERNNMKEISFGFWRNLLPSKGTFEYLELDLSTKKGIIDILKSEIAKFNKLSSADFRINILSEVPPGSGLGFSGAFGASLAAAIYLYFKKVTIKEIKSWNETSVMELIQKRGDFNKIFRLAWKIESLIQGGNSSGGAPFCSLINSYFPIVLFSQKRTDMGELEKTDSEILPSDVSGNYDLIDRILYQGARLNDIFGLKYFNTFPIHFGLIYSGETTSTSNAVDATREEKDFLNGLIKFDREFRKDFIVPESKPHLFYSEELKKEKNLWNLYLKLSTVISLRVIGAFKNLFQKGFSKKAMKDLVKGVNDYQSFFRLLGLSTNNIEEINTFIKGIFFDKGIAGAIKITGGGMGGDILFVVPHSSLIDGLDYIIEELRKKINKNIFFDYLSWIDGIEDNGVKIEHSVESKIYSEFASEGIVYIKKMERSGDVRAITYSLQEYKKNKPKIDLLLDSVNTDIYIKNKKLTSKDIRSASTTIKMMELLLNSAEKRIKNKDLPISSYRNDRNELQSKIISPLKKAINKRLKKKLAIEIHGGITDFYIELKPTNLEIYFLEKIF